MTDAEYLAWLQRDGVQRELLCELAYYGGTRYISRLGFVSGPSDTPASTVYDDLVLQVPQYSVKATELFTGRTLPTWGELHISNEDGSRDSWLDDAWDGRAQTLLLGDPAWPRADFRAIFTGVADDIVSINPDRHALKLRGREHLLNKQLQTNHIAGSTANVNQPVPICVGQCFNVSPVWNGSAWQVHDGAVNAISAVRVNGVAGVPTTSIATGTFTLAAAAGGQVTADVQGAKPGGTYHSTTGAIIRYLLTTFAGLSDSDLDLTSLTDLDTAAPYVVGLYIKDRANVIDVVDQLVTSVGAGWTFTRDGKLRVFRLEAPSGSADLELTADDLAERGLRVNRRILPVAVARVTYARNWTPQSPGSLAAALSDDDRTLYAAPYWLKTATNSVAQHLMAPQPAERSSLIVSETDAQTEATRVAALYAQLRYVYGLDCFTAPNRTNLGDIINLDHPRFGFAGGVPGVCVGITETPTSNRVGLELFA